MTFWFYIMLLTHIWRLWFSKSTEHSTVVKKKSQANTKRFLKSYCDFASLTDQDPHFTMKWVKFVLVGLFEIILPLHLSSLKASAGELWPFWVLYAKKDIKQVRRIQTRLGNLRYGKDWKNWVCLPGKWDRSTITVFKHIKGIKKGKRRNCTPKWLK